MATATEPSKRSNDNRALLIAGCLVVAWAVWNAATVYLVLGGERQHRLETAVLILVSFAIVAEAIARAARFSTRADPPPALAMNARRMLVATSVVLWLANWLTTAGVPFLSDDYVLLDRYRESAAHAPQQFFRPVFGAVFWALSWVGGESTIPFRIAGAALHVGSALLASHLAAGIARSATAGTVGFVLFLLNPLQAEAVVWIAGLQETLWTFLALAALAVHAQVEWPSLFRIGAVGVLSGLAFGAKETAACLVVLLPGLDVARGRAIHGWNLATYGIVAAELAAYLALRSRYVALESDALATPTRYFVKQFVTLPYQLYVQPWSTAAITMPAAISFGTAAVGIAGIAWTLIGRRLWRVPASGAFVILASTLPLVGYFFVRDDLAGARYLYFGAFGWALLVWSALASTMPSPRMLGTAAAGLAMAWGFLLHVNLRPWRQAGDVVRHMETAAIAGQDPAAAAEQHARSTGVPLISRDGIPRELGGVGLFVNGYPEFIARIGPRRGR